VRGQVEVRMTTVVVVEEDLDPYPAPPRWLYIVAGILWVLISIVVLSFDSTSAATIGFMMGIVLIIAGADEFMTMVLAPGWKWVHGILGALFVLAGIGAMLNPFQTFGILALLIGWYLVFKGFFDIALSIGARRQLPLWGLTLAVGIAEVLLGLWALGYPGRSAWLLVLWVGIGAMLHGIGDLVVAFTMGRDK
jgi:uncharacterized membrane protein HdeD (DUF308 family)